MDEEGEKRMDKMEVYRPRHVSACGESTSRCPPTAMEEKRKRGGKKEREKEQKDEE